MTSKFLVKAEGVKRKEWQSVQGQEEVETDRTPGELSRFDDCQNIQMSAIRISSEISGPSLMLRATISDFINFPPSILFPFSLTLSHLPQQGFACGNQLRML
jgi:hypothetical protein